MAALRNPHRILMCMTYLLSFLMLVAALAGGLCRQEQWPEIRCRICAAIASAPFASPAVTGWALNNQGLGLQDIGDLLVAGELFERAIRHAPTAPRYHNNLGNVRVAMHQHQAAEVAYQRAVALEPAYGRAWLNLGMLRLSIDDVAGAHVDVETAVKLQPRSASALTVRGIIRTMQGDLAGAFSDHTQALARSPAFNVIYSNRSCTHILAGRLTLAALDRTYAVCPNLPNQQPVPPHAACLDQRRFIREVALLRARIPLQRLRLIMFERQSVQCGLPPAHR